MIGEKYVVEVNTTDVFDQLVKDSKLLGKLKAEGERRMNTFGYLLQDIYYALFLDNPRLLPLEQISTGARLNMMIIEELMKGREFKKARTYTRQDVLSSGMFTSYFAEFIISGLDAVVCDTVNEIHCCQEELVFALVQQRTAEKVVRIAEEEGKVNSAEAYRASAEQWSLLAADKSKQLRTLAARLRMLWNTGARKNIAVSGADVRGEKKERFETGAEGLGDNKGAWTKGDLKPHLKLVEEYYNSPKLKRLAQRVGKLREVRETGLRAQNEDVSEVGGITYGNDLAMVVPEEWADYFNNIRKSGFRKKFAEESLCLYDIKVKKHKGKGSMIICIDNSGSMQGPKEETCKAIAIALMEIAVYQKRDFMVIMFGGPDDELKVFEIKKGICTFDQLIEIGEHFLCSSGTDFEKPLRHALRFLEKDKYRGGDILFLTDGVCSVSPEFLETYHEQKKARGFRTITVMVNYGQVPTAPLEAFSDELLYSKDLKGLDVAGELFGKIRGE